MSTQIRLPWPLRLSNLNFIYIHSTVKLGYNEREYSKLSAIANKKITLVGSGLFIGRISRLQKTKLGYNERFFLSVSEKWLIFKLEI